MNTIAVVVAFTIAVVIINPRNTNSTVVGSLLLLYFLLFIVDTVAVVDVGVCVVIIINPPNSNSSRCNDIAAIDHTINSVVVVVANSVVIIDPHTVIPTMGW